MTDQPHAARLADAENGWQPIETAPKDGTPVLLWGDEKIWTDDIAPSVGWFARGSAKWVSRANWITPTHWMPLPAPPETERDDDG